MNARKSQPVALAWELVVETVVEGGLLEQSNGEWRKHRGGHEPERVIFGPDYTSSQRLARPSCGNPRTSSAFRPACRRLRAFRWCRIERGIGERHADRCDRGPSS